MIETETAAVTCRPDLTAGDKLLRPMPLRAAFSADGRFLYYTAPRAVFRIPVDGGPPEEMFGARTRGGLTVSPSGHALVMSMCTMRTSLLAIGGPPIEALAAVREIDWPAVASDGSFAYIVNQRTIVLRGPDGATRELVVLTDGSASELTISPDGRTLAYQVAGGANAGLFELNTKSGLPNRVTAAATAGGPVLAGDAIVFTRTEADTSPHLAWSALAGGEHEARDRARVALAASPDGRILTTTPARDHFYWWDRATDSETAGPPLVLAEEVKTVRISPRGTWLVARVGANGRKIYRLRLDVASATPELVRELSTDLRTQSATIDDAGVVYAVVGKLEGELEAVFAQAGTTW